MKCPNCGSIIPDDALFCNTCGTRLNVSDLKEKSLDQEFKKSTTSDASFSNSAENSQSKDAIRSRVTKKKDKTVIWVLVTIICIIGLVHRGYTTYIRKESKAFIEEYTKSKYKNHLESQNLTDISNSSNDIAAFHRELENSANEYNKHLPQYMGNGVTMLKCHIEEETMVYTFQWEGIAPLSLSTEDVRNIKRNYIENVKKQIPTSMKSMLIKMEKYGYNILHRGVNENGASIYSYFIEPSELY